MRAVVQRVFKARVEIENKLFSRINKGLLVYLSVGREDTEEDARFIADKLVNLRVFADQAGRMNRSICDVGGSILLISNFTLHGDCRKGRRPSFDAAAEPVLARQLYEKTAELIAQEDVPVEMGVFGEHMRVCSTNDGPVTLLLDSR